MASMSEHLFPSGAPSAPPPDILSAAILHHLLVRRPAGASPRHLAQAMFGASPGPRQRAHLMRALAGLSRDDLVDLRVGAVHATRAARAFHRIMLGGAP